MKTLLALSTFVITVSSLRDFLHYLHVPCTAKLGYLVTKTKTCMSGEICYDEEKDLVQRVVEGGCLEISLGDNEEYSEFGMMRKYIVKADGFGLQAGQKILLPSVHLPKKNLQPREYPIIEVFTLKDGKIYRSDP